MATDQLVHKDALGASVERVFEHGVGWVLEENRPKGVQIIFQ